MTDGNVPLWISSLDVPLLISGLSMIATVALAFVGYRGLTSLKLFRAEAIARAERQSIECAIERGREFANEIIPLHSTFTNGLSGHKVPAFLNHPDEVKFASPEAEAEQLASALEWIKKVPREVYRDGVMLANRLECWSMYFTKPLAASEAVMEPCSPSFCTMVLHLYPILINSRGKETSGDFPNLVHLFQSWFGKLQDEKNQRQATDLLAQANRLQLNGPWPKLPRPVGTDLDEV